LATKNIRKKPFSSKLRHLAFRSGKLPSPATDTSDSKSKADPTRRKRHLGNYRRWLWPYLGALLMVFLLALLGAGLDMVWPLALKHIIDGATLVAREQLKRLAPFWAEVRF